MSLEQEVRETLDAALKPQAPTAGDGTIGTLGPLASDTEGALRDLTRFVAGLNTAVQQIAREVDQLKSS